MSARPDTTAAAAEILAHKGRWQRKAARLHGYVRVMGVIDHWVVARFSGAAPFVTHVNQWASEFEIADQWVGRKR